MPNLPDRLDELRGLLASLAGDRNALVRSAVGLALDELDRADLTDDPTPHLVQVDRLIDAVLNPSDRDGEDRVQR